MGTPPCEIGIGRPVRSGRLSWGIDTQEVIHRRDEVAGRNGRVFDVGAK